MHEESDGLYVSRYSPVPLNHFWLRIYACLHVNSNHILLTVSITSKLYLL